MPRTLKSLLTQQNLGILLDKLEYWRGAPESEQPRERVVDALHTSMTDAAVIERKYESLPSPLAKLLGSFLRRPGYARRLAEILDDRSLAGHGEYQIEAFLSDLERKGFVWCADTLGWIEPGERCYFLPTELGDLLGRQLRSRDRSVYQCLTLKGYLEHLAETREKGSSQSIRTRQTYKLFSSQEAILRRLDALEEPLQSLVQKALTSYGGLLPRSVFEHRRFATEEFRPEAWREALEKHSLGTVADLALSRYGIHLNEETIILFSEVVMAYLERSTESVTDTQPAKRVAMGVDLVSNVSRFLTYVLESHVKFTVKGRIFKTTERKIVDSMIPTQSGEIDAADLLDLIYRFALAKDLVVRTGERVFAVSNDGKNWDDLELAIKVKALLDYVVEEQMGSGEYYHQVRMRRILLRILKRLEPTTWYPAMFLPFVVRNHYLASLEEWGVDKFFSSRFQYTRYTPMEGVQEMCWNLFTWVRQRLHPLGLVDLGYDEAGRPVSFSLSRLGAEALDMIPAGEFDKNRPQIVVNPDFEIVLFPSGNEFHLIHALDRFCVREKSDQLYHFRLSEESVRRAVTEGLSIDSMRQTLQRHARVPIPQNVLFTLNGWANRSGVLSLADGMVVRCESPDLLDRFVTDPRVAPWVAERLGPQAIRMKSTLDRDQLRSLIRDSGYLADSA